MAFLIYDLVSSGNDGQYYTFNRKMPINTIAKTLADYFRNVNNGIVDKWHLEEKTLLELLEFSAGRSAFVIDLKPTTPRNVSLLRLKDIWGYTYEWWTPVLLRLEIIFLDHDCENPDQFKLKFDDKNSEKQIIHEFLYLQAGMKHGKRSWGATGQVNAALLFPGALAYFSEILDGFLNKTTK